MGKVNDLNFPAQTTLENSFHVPHALKHRLLPFFMKWDYILMAREEVIAGEDQPFCWREKAHASGLYFYRDDNSLNADETTTLWFC